jgi:hypothetical protein
MPTASVDFTRPADTTAYTANDVVGATAAALTFPNLGSPDGSEVIITSASVRRDSSAIVSGETSYRLHLYNVTPPSAPADNAAWNLPSGDRASYLGYVDIGAITDLGSTLWAETSNIGKQVKLLSGSLYGLLVTIGAYTPVSADTFNVKLACIPAHNQAN